MSSGPPPPPPAPVSTAKAQIPQVCVGEENQPPQIIHPDLSPVTEEPSSGNDQVCMPRDERLSGGHLAFIAA